jgi:subtilisin family serine protease
MARSNQEERKRRTSPLMAAIRSRLWAAALAICMLVLPASADAATRLIVRVQSQSLLQSACWLLGCTVQYGLGDAAGQYYLVTSPLTLPLNVFLNLPGVLEAEVDSVGHTMDAVSQGPVPSALLDSTPVQYFGATVRDGYINQPATQIVRLAAAQSTFQVAGTGIVAVIDTGVDTTHPVLQNVLLPGYDFTRNNNGADEKGDVTQSTTAVVDQSTTAVVDQSTTAVVDQQTASTLNQTQYAGFGHGTMTAGIVHLVAPQAFILPLKAFGVDGTGYASDVIRAINYAVRNNANVLSMSFSFASSSQAVKEALTHANAAGVIAVAAAGNSGQQTLVYPAAYQSMVMGVASTTNNDTLSSFSNYGQNLVWVGAPGEGIITLYPYGTYAATWGTSFSTPFVAGTAALLLNLQGGCMQPQAAQAIAHAKFISAALGNGRLDIFQALQAW